jgi:hypothetical protein
MAPSVKMPDAPCGNQARRMIHPNAAKGATRRSGTIAASKGLI